jgi:hypothetical protein
MLFLSSASFVFTEERRRSIKIKPFPLLIFQIQVNFERIKKRWRGRRRM